MTTNATAIKPSEALEVEVLFPCKCGNTDDYVVHLIAYSQAGFDCGDIGSNHGTSRYGDINVDEVECHRAGCDAFYTPREARVACIAYRVYLDRKSVKAKKVAWDKFLDARKKAEKVQKK